MSKKKTDFRTLRARRDSAMARPELRAESERREAPAGATSFPIKVASAEDSRLVADFLARKGQKRDVPANQDASDSGWQRGRDSA
jgi:hypothetical protein